MFVNVPEVERRIDRLEWLEVYVYLSFLSFRGDDFSAVNNKPVGRHFGPQFEPLLSGRDRRQYREPGCVRSQHYFIRKEILICTNRLTRLLMLEAVPYGYSEKLWIMET